MKDYCVFEPITPDIEEIRAVVVDALVGRESEYSDIARQDPEFDEQQWIKRERKIASIAMENIRSNIEKLVKNPDIRTVHLSELNSDLIQDFRPDSIIISGTLRDFDYYDPAIIENFNRFIIPNRVPVLGICGGHQLVGQAFGATVITIDNQLPSKRRTDRITEYQYRFVKIIDTADPIFAGMRDPSNQRWQDYTKKQSMIRVWQNHGLQLDRLPEGFHQLARGYLSEIQMMVRRTREQLIYGVQFHIEKSFQDWEVDKYWEHRNESRDGRLLFEHFLIEALRFRDPRKLKSA
jgi:GMP synthase-like glutamine amidotransferase